MSILSNGHLGRQLAFLREIDSLKSVIRQSRLLDGSRRENSAEHSWHLAMHALLLEQYAAGEVNAGRVVRMLLIHDIVEVDVGDTPIHGAGSATTQAALEDKAAVRLFGMLPCGQGEALLELWREFERGDSADARFAKALDRVQPLLANIATGGGTWTDNQVTREQVVQRYGPVIERGSPALWNACLQSVQEHFANQALPSSARGLRRTAGE